MPAEVPANRTAEALALLALADGAGVGTAARESGLALTRVELIAHKMKKRCTAALATDHASNPKEADWAAGLHSRWAARCYSRPVPAEVLERRTAEAVALLALADSAGLVTAARESGLELARVELIAHRMKKRCVAALKAYHAPRKRAWPDDYDLFANADGWDDAEEVDPLHMLWMYGYDGP